MRLWRRPARTPCKHCPYRRDVASGIWAKSEYEKLPPYDLETGEQPTAVFGCHVEEESAESPIVCGGWAGCHDGEELMSIRIAIALGHMTIEVAQAVRDYVSPVPLFESGAAAAEHGMREIENPSPEAVLAIDAIGRMRTDITIG